MSASRAAPRLGSTRGCRPRRRIALPAAPPRARGGPARGGGAPGRRGGAGRAPLVAAAPDDLTDRFDAVELVRLGGRALGGQGGGGRPDMAQAGGPDGTKAEAALAAIERAVAEAAGAARPAPA